MNSCRRGVTLIEILVAMTVLSLVTTAALTLYLPSLGRFASADTAYDAQRHAVAAIKMMGADLRETSYTVLVNANHAVSDTALCIPTPRDPAGLYHILSDDTPDWQGWVQYWLTPEPAPARTYSLYRAFVAGHPDSAPPPTGLGNGRMVASGIESLRMEAGVTPLAVTSAGGIARRVDLTSAAATPGGRGKVHLFLKTSRELHDLRTTFEEEKTVDIPF